MRLRIVAVGRIKDPVLRQACQEYADRIQRYVRLDIAEVRDAKRPDAEAAEARRVEGEAIRKAAPGHARLIALTRGGTALTSGQFAERVHQWQADARDTILAVGGAHGLDDAILLDADEALSLSSFTLPHELARLVLLEQLYRACTILRKEPYHKGRDR
jgi:23S rRNA (pseudouridine1915-N3)-methyltransferase